MLRPALTALASALALTVALPAFAIGERVEVQVVDRTTGESLKPVYRDGTWWVAGRPGARYGVAITNRDGRRTLNVVSIDGVNAISGDTAAWDQTGYVLDPYRRTTIDGWRKSVDEVAAFEFASLPDSYAARTGRPDQVGVIGIAVFDEKRPVPRVDPVASGMPGPRGEARRGSEPSSAATTPAPASRYAPAADAVPPPTVDAEVRAKAVVPAQRERLGTAHGAIERSSITYVAFQREQSRPNEIVTIRYDRLENLIAMGIVPAPGSLPPIAGDPFPASRRYVPDPPAR